MNLQKDDRNNLKISSLDNSPWNFLSRNHQSTAKKIKSYIFDKNTRCCYCLRKFLNKHGLEYDLEHILPVTHFKKVAFNLRNLNIACHRCNRKIKNDKIYFNYNSKKLFSQKNYQILHPNLTKIDRHIEILEYYSNERQILLYKISSNSEQAKFTYAEFRLADLVKEEISLSNGSLKTVTYDEINKKMDLLFK